MPNDGISGVSMQVTVAGASSFKGVDSTGHEVKAQTECHKARCEDQSSPKKECADKSLSLIGSASQVLNDKPGSTGVDDFNLSAVVK